MAQSQAITKILTDTELRVFEAMRYLDRTRPKSPTQTEVAKFLECDPSTVNRAISGLEEKGAIETERGNKYRSRRTYRIFNLKRMRQVRNAKTA
jgi:DNA-binding MarR family transcriptional regulator